MSSATVTSIARTSPLDLVDLRKTQRRVAALLNRPDFFACFFRGKKKIPAGFCYVCSQLDPKGRGGRVNPYRHLFAKGGLWPCPHLPAAPHPTFVSGDDDDFDDGFEEDFSYDGGSDDGAMFDTKIIREDSEVDPRTFALPPVFGKSDADQLHPQARAKRRRKKDNRIVPLVSEQTFLSTHPRGQGQGQGQGRGQEGARWPAASGEEDGVRLPQLQRSSVVNVRQGVEEGEGRGKVKDPRRLHSERIDRKAPGDVLLHRSDSSYELGLTREKTDPPPQPILVSIRGQNGEIVHRVPLDKLPPGTLPSAGFINDSGVATGNEEEGDDVAGGQGQRRSRKRKEKKKKRRGGEEEGGGSPYSPSFSGSLTFSRETTLDSVGGGPDSPDLFRSRLRSASWCECPHEKDGSAPCSECRRVGGSHEKWCVSRNTICGRCGKAFKRKYSQLLGPEGRKPSFGALPSAGLIITSNGSRSPGAAAATRGEGKGRDPSNASGSFNNNNSSNNNNRHPARSPDAAVSPSKGGKGLDREASFNRVRFQHEDGTVVYPQWDPSLGESALSEEVGESNLAGSSKTSRSQGRRSKEKDGKRSSAATNLDPNVHRQAYDLALADARMNLMFKPKKKKKGDQQENFRGIYFSYFPSLKKKPRRRAPAEGAEDPAGVPEVPHVPLGLRADSREGKRLKVKKGLQHILGHVKLDDYYPGGKNHPKTTFGTTGQKQ